MNKNRLCHRTMNEKYVCPKCSSTDIHLIEGAFEFPLYICEKCEFKAYNLRVFTFVTKQRGEK